MIEYRTGDLFEQNDVNIIVHQCNCFHTMGGGIARLIKEKYYPEAYEADLKTEYGSKDKLGTYSMYVHEKDHMIIINLYSQFNYGCDNNQTDYEAMRKGFQNLREEFCNSGISETVIGIPHGIGCGLAGGDWNIVENIIKEVFDDVEDKIVICKL